MSGVDLLHGMSANILIEMDPKKEATQMSKLGSICILVISSTGYPLSTGISYQRRTLVMVHSHLSGISKSTSNESGPHVYLNSL